MISLPAFHHQQREFFISIQIGDLMLAALERLLKGAKKVYISFSMNSIN
jgi:hypothetical protein